MLRVGLDVGYSGVGPEWDARFQSLRRSRFSPSTDVPEQRLIGTPAITPRNLLAS